MARLVYNLLLVLLSPVLAAYLLWRLARGKEDRAHWGERWGSLPAPVAEDRGSPRFWVHAVSVGEVMAAVPVLRELRRRFPDAYILLSTTTLSGREVALQQTADEVVYFPLDLPFAVRRALRCARPDAVLLMEWEIWPNFLAEAKRRNAKIAVLNGRISDRGLRRGGKAAFFTRPGLDAVDRFAMQSDEDARRAALVGADARKVVTLGNTKFDEAATPVSDAERARLRDELGIPPHAPVWICGSTRPGEEEILAEAFGDARRAHPGLRLIVAPRHIERAAAVEEILRAAGLEVVRRSQQKALAASAVRASNAILLDTFGELGRVYAVADVAFVGGSLLPFGGQSVFQPLAQGVPALFGPHMNNQRDIAALARRVEVGFEVRDAEELAEELRRLLALPEAEKRALSERARALIEQNQGVSARCVEAVASLLRAGGRDAAAR